MFSVFLSCQDNDMLSQDQEAQRLQDLFIEIESMVSTFSCDNSMIGLS